MWERKNEDGNPEFTPRTDGASWKPNAPGLQPSPPSDFSKYVFPISIDPNQRYLFYLHGKIIEDQGIPAVSPDFGEYEYGAILKKFEGYGFTVISEPRPTITDGLEYAIKVASQVHKLLDAGVLPKIISVVGASKGGDIAIYTSHLIENPDIRYVIMAICKPVEVAGLKQRGYAFKESPFHLRLRGSTRRILQRSF